ncbi:MAG: magnesium transporter MgtC [Bacteroidetes bacterium]|nr:MAG: magnesium transporter MgtC [Bacteroidota bacterium]
MLIPTEILIKLVLAIVIGGLIGAEREYRSKSAGFRTLMLICLGATVFTIMSQILGGVSTPDRIASNVVVGIGFVGAGVIFKSADSRVNGITTAATIWVTAALGVAIGAGRELLAVGACLLVLAILFLFTTLEGWIDKKNQIRIYKIVCPFENITLSRFEEVFKDHHLKHKRSRQSKIGGIITGEWLVQGTEKNHLECINYILQDESVNEFDF